MKKILFIILVTILLCGCENSKEVKNEEFKFGEFYTYCDDEYGVEYIHYIDGYRGGITVRLDQNGNIIHCDGTNSKKMER